MPDMDGVQLLRWLGEHSCRAGILLMSGMDKRVLETAEALARALGLTVVGHLQKPFRLAQLEAFLQSEPARRVQSHAAPDQSARFTAKELQRALDAHEFVLHYQPQVAIETGSIVGFEALVRWRHPVDGLIFPDSFIDLMESFGMIAQLGWLVVHRGLADLVHLERAAGGNPTLSLNISAHSLTDLMFPDRMASLTRQHGVSPEVVILEITESGLIQNLSKALDILMRLRMKRFQLSIDDFGTGYAMMQQLRTVPATELKIDKSFVQEMHDKDAARVVVEKTIEIGHALGMKVIAEGVETSEQLAMLRAHGCDLAQGYLFSRALAIDEMCRWLVRRRSPAL
jgi:EAL domain-containing protein (putative c-di-GMP-specific phosphodiesterase class I)